MAFAGVAHAQIIAPDWTVPGQLIEEVDVPDEVWVNGVPTRMRAARSSWKADDLFRHYYRIMEKARLFIPPEAKQVKVAKSLQLTGVEVGTNVTVTVVLTPVRDGTTNVIIGQADFSRFKKPGASDVEVPLGPGAEHVMRTRAEGLSTVNYESKSTDKAILDHYDRELGKRGYQKLKDGYYEEGNRQFRVTFSRSKEGATQVTATELTTPPVGGAK